MDVALVIVPILLMFVQWLVLVLHIYVLVELLRY